MSPWHWVAVQATQISMESAVSCLPGSKKATGCSPDPGPLYGPWWQQMGHGIQHRPSYNRTMGPDMVFGNSSGLDVTWSQVEAKYTHISMAPVAVQASDTNTAPGGDPDSVHQHGPQWQHETQISTQALAAVSPQMQMWPLAAALAQTSPWHWIVAYSTQNCMAWL